MGPWRFMVLNRPPLYVGTAESQSTPGDRLQASSVRGDLSPEEVVVATRAIDDRHVGGVNAHQEPSIMSSTT